MEAKNTEIIYIIARVNEIFASTEIHQFYVNLKENPVELTLSYPIQTDFILSKFQIKLNGKTIVSKILNKEKAEKKYDDSIASGNSSFISRYSNRGNSFEINIGNVLPNEKIELMTEYYQILSSEDLSYCFRLIQIYPQLKLNKSKFYEYYGIKCDIHISTMSPLTRLVTLNKIKLFHYNENIVDNFQYAKISITSGNIVSKGKNVEISNKKLPYSCLKILFRTEECNSPTLYYQYDKTKNETAYFFHFLISNVKVLNKYEMLISENKIEEINQLGNSLDLFVDTDNKISYYNKYISLLDNSVPSPSNFIIIIDQSGSMSGNPIETLKQSIIMFLKNLPYNSYFQLIGFGSTFKVYNEQPYLFNDNNINKILLEIKKIKADLGGTNLYKPLYYVYSSFEKYKKLNLANNIIVFTDGLVPNIEQLCHTISNNKKHFRLHALGIGLNFDKNLIDRMSQAGKGIKAYIPDYLSINIVIFKILQMYTRSYYKNLELIIEKENNYFNNKNYIIFPNSSFIYPDELLVNAFISNGEPRKTYEGLKAILKFQKGVKNEEKANNYEIKNIFKFPDGNTLSRLIIGNYINSTLNPIPADECIKLSKDYQILSQHTAIFGEILRENENTTGSLLEVSNNYLNEAVEPKYSTPKTGKHGKAKKILINENELVENQTYDNNEMNFFGDENIKKEVKYIIENQNIDEGYWDKEIVYKDNKKKEIYNSIKEYLEKQNIQDIYEENSIIITILNILILENYFKENKLFYIISIIKAIEFLKKKGIDFEDLKKNIQL